MNETRIPRLGYHEGYRDGYQAGYMDAQDNTISAYSFDYGDFQPSEWHEGYADGKLNARSGSGYRTFSPNYRKDREPNMTTTRWKVRTDKPEEVTTDGGSYTFICEARSATHAAQIVREHNAHAINEKARLTLEGLTPGGSEYVNDPERCAAYLQQIKSDCVEMNKTTVRLQRVNAALVEALKLASATLRAKDGPTAKERDTAVESINAALRQARGE